MQVEKNPSNESYIAELSTGVLTHEKNLNIKRTEWRIRCKQTLV